MKTRILTTLMLLLSVTALHISAQNYNTITPDGMVRPSNREGRIANDSVKGNTEIPRGLKVWTVDETFGDMTETEADTMAYMYMNTIFTTGLRGEYNTTGNLGAARQNRIFTDRNPGMEFIFTQHYDYFLKTPEEHHFTNTYSPITNLSFNTCGNRLNGEDHFQALFAVNAGKRLGLGFKFNYLYGRGYYQENSSSLMDFTLYGSYLGDRYQAHLLTTLNHQKQAENGGITNDDYITHPEIFQDNYSENEIPTMLAENWNRNDNQHIFFTHRYSLGFNRKVPMTEEEIKAKKFAMESKKDNDARRAKDEARKKAEEGGEEFDEMEYDRQLEITQSTAPDDVAPADTSWLKNEYVPVTSFIHTLKLGNYKRIYQAYQTPTNYYANTYPTLSRFVGDSIHDRTTHLSMRNTFAIALLEGFNKYAKAGLKAYAAHEFMRFTLPDTINSSRTYTENDFYVGGQISKTQGNTLHYNVTGEVEIAGTRIGDVMVDGQADLNFPLLGDTVQLVASGFFHLNDPSFYYSTYHAKHFWWDGVEMDKTMHTKIQGELNLPHTDTHLRVAVDNLSNYAYFSTDYTIGNDYLRLYNTVRPRQTSSNISILTATLEQRLRLGILHLDTQLSYQQSSKEDIIPVPALNAYANLFLRFKIAHVLDCDLGADVRYFTKYNAPDFIPGIAQYAIQENADNKVKVGNYPIVNLYANFFLKHTRFFAMMSHVNYTDGGNYFLTPHYPINQRIFRFGVSWNFFN